MNNFFLDFRDPLFGLILFFVIIFVITLSSYWWGRYKNQEDSKQLDKFLDGFRSLPTQDELGILIKSKELSEKSWLLLADAYYKNGDYEKSIEIYNEILKTFENINSKDTLFLLGRTYFKAGFLERSKQIFLEILKRSPRTPQALEYLLLVYENLRDYKGALDVLEPLETLGIDVTKEYNYLKALQILHNSTLLNEQKAQQLLEIYIQTKRFTYLIFEFLFRVDPQLAWKHLPKGKPEYVSDLLWYLPLKDMNLDIISKNKYLWEFYSARGDIALCSGSDIFELDVLIQLQGKAKATLNFEYVCDTCKHSYPFAFHRCTNCHGIDTLRVEFNLTKDNYRNFSEENNSFQ